MKDKLISGLGLSEEEKLVRNTVVKKVKAQNL